MTREEKIAAAMIRWFDPEDLFRIMVKLFDYQNRDRSMRVCLSPLYVGNKFADQCCTMKRPSNKDLRRGFVLD